MSPHAQKMLKSIKKINLETLDNTSVYERNMAKLMKKRQWCLQQAALKNQQLESACSFNPKLQSLK